MRIKEVIERFKEFDQEAELLIIEPEMGDYMHVKDIEYDSYANMNDDRHIVNFICEYAKSDDDDFKEIQELENAKHDGNDNKNAG